MNYSLVKYASLDLYSNYRHYFDNIYSMDDIIVAPGNIYNPFLVSVYKEFTPEYLLKEIKDVSKFNLTEYNINLHKRDFFIFSIIRISDVNRLELATGIRWSCGVIFNDFSYPVSIMETLSEELRLVSGGALFRDIEKRMKGL